MTGTFALFRWSGDAGDQPKQLQVKIDGIKPEAMFAIPGTDKVQLLSDDGSAAVGNKVCKGLLDDPDEMLKVGFRTRIIDID